MTSQKVPDRPGVLKHDRKGLGQFETGKTPSNREQGDIVVKRQSYHPLFTLCVAVLLLLLSGCGSGGDSTADDSGQNTDIPIIDPDGGPPAGNPDGDAPVPVEGSLEDVSDPDHIIGSGTPESCSAESFIDAVASGGTIVFDCGPDPITLTLPEPAKVFNDADPDIIIDGGGLVTLSGGGQNRILYMNTCDPDQEWTTSHCQDQDHPRLTVQNITFANGNSSADIRLDATIMLTGAVHRLPRDWRMTSSVDVEAV